MASFATVGAFTGLSPAPFRKLPSTSPRGLSCLVMAKKSFDKKYGDAFDDFRTSGSMPSIPSISEQYKKAQGFVQQQGLAVSEEQFGARVTNEKEALTKERDMGLEAYEELKKELLEDTAFIGFLVLFLGCIWLPDKQVLSYFVGK
jgi:hypothetical protein